MRRFTILLCAVLVPATLTLGACDGDDEEEGDGDGTADVGDVVEQLDTAAPDVEGPDARPDIAQGDDVGGADAEASDASDTSEPDPCADNERCDFSGNLQLHPVTAQLDSEATVGGASVSIVSASTAIGGSPEVLQTEASGAATETYPTSSTETMASWSFDGVGVGDVAVGTVALARDSEEVAEPTFLPTATGLTAGKPTEDVTEAASFVLTQSTEGDLANLIAEASDGDDIQGPGDLAAQGFILLQFVDTAGEPVAGVTVTRDGHATGDQGANESGDRLAEAYYPNADYTSASQGPFATTSETGVAILPGATVAEYGGVQVETDTQYNLERAGSTGGFGFVGVRTPVTMSAGGGGG
jgi:hypothetical protein